MEERLEAKQEERREKGEGCRTWELGSHHAARRRIETGEEKIDKGGWGFMLTRVVF